MEGFELINQGAEARIYKGFYQGKPTIAKERFVKKYRHPDLDKRITKERIRAEERIIARCQEAGIRTPTIYATDKDKRTIFMEYFDKNITVKDFINKSIYTNQLETLSYQIGTQLGKMHSKNIIHGDLTTSNMLLINDKVAEFKKLSDLELVFIDFGLAHFQAHPEDKAVDLYVLERALISTHSTAKEIFEAIMKGYKSEYKNCDNVLKKFEEVRARGRKRTMIG